MTETSMMQQQADSEKTEDALMTALAELGRLAAAATPGPWASDSTGVWTLHPDGLCGPVLDAHDPTSPPHDGIGTVGDSYPRGINHPSENMRFIAACSPDAIIALVDGVRRRLQYVAAHATSVTLDDVTTALTETEPCQ